MDRNYLHPDNSHDITDISAQGLAHLGDAVYELMVRTWLCTEGMSTARGMHERAVNYVSAKSQASVVDTITGMLDEEELSVFKRGRNVHINSTPKGSTHGEYSAATGLEALFGYLYLCGKTERLNSLFEVIIKHEV